MWPDNQVVKVGLLSINPVPDMPRSTYISPNMVYPDGNINLTQYIESGKQVNDCMTTDVLVGHNIKFDLLYALKNKWIRPEQLVGIKVWDTQLAEYLLSAQTHTYPSLNDCAVKYGGTLKDDRIKEFWDADTPTEKIPEAMLGEYLYDDLLNTEKVFLAQVTKVEEWGMSALISSQMNALVATTLMEYNGMSVDREYVTKQAAILGEQIKETEKTLLSSIGAFIPPLYGEWQWSSPKDVSALFFGCTYKVKEKQLVGKYKNGNDKFKIVEVPYEMAGIAPLSASSYGANLNKLGYWTTDDVVLKNLPFSAAEDILRLRMLSKQKETYYENLASLLFPSNKIHANLNLVSTKTGRLSCNKPNIQNQTVEGGIKNAYVSRWGDDGVLVDFDYSQLEMAGLACIANDEQLAYDINHGIDMHEELYKEMYGRLPTKDERKKFKPLSFGLVYGAGAKTLAANADCSIADAKRFIDVFYSRYKGVGAFHNDIQEEARKGRKLTKKHSDKGLPVGAYLKKMPTGRMYCFTEYDNEWKGGVSFSPTELKNWPVQGFATGDIVPHMVGAVVKMLYSAGAAEYALPIMTVHDSIVFDVKKKMLDKFVKACKIVLSNTTPIVEKHFGIEMPVRLSVGCSYGPNWGDQKEINLKEIV